MKYAVISDIHGNMPALQAVLEDSVRQNVDSYILAGDYYMCLQYPNEVVNIIRQLKNAYIIKGNNEPFLDKLSNQNQQTWTDGQFEAMYWYYRTITPENFRFLKELPVKTKIYEQGHPYICIQHSSTDLFHTTLFDELSSPEFLSCNKSSGINKKDYIQAQIKAVTANHDFNSIKNLPDGIYIVGHTHFQWHYNFNGKILLNPGSCGLPVDLDNRASYSILECNENSFNVEERRISYNIELLIKDLMESSLYKSAEVWSRLTVDALMTGAEQHTFFLKFAEKYANDIGDNERPFSKKTWNDAYLLWKT